MTDWVQVAQQLGIPFVVILAIGFGIWRVMVWVGPRLDKALNAHLELVDSTTKATQATTENVKEIRGLLEASHNTHKELYREMVEHRAKMESA